MAWRLGWRGLPLMLDRGLGSQGARKVTQVKALGEPSNSTLTGVPRRRCLSSRIGLPLGASGEVGAWSFFSAFSFFGRSLGFSFFGRPTLGLGGGGSTLGLGAISLAKALI